MNPIPRKQRVALTALKEESSGATSVLIYLLANELRNPLSVVAAYDQLRHQVAQTSVIDALACAADILKDAILDMIQADWDKNDGGSHPATAMIDFEHRFILQSNTEKSLYWVVKPSADGFIYDPRHDRTGGRSTGDT